MLNYLSKFAPHLASVMKPMTDLLKADVSWTWDHPQQEAFEAAKQLVSNLPSLSYYSIGSDVIVSADASGYGLGAVLLQRKGDALLPIAFASRTLTDAEKSYAPIEKECLASVWACEKFQKYLIGLEKFDLWTDHKPLVALIGSKDLMYADAVVQ